MKSINEMNYEDLCAHIAGDLILSIGTGNFKSRVNVWVGYLIERGKRESKE